MLGMLGEGNNEMNMTPETGDCSRGGDGEKMH